MAAAAAVKPVWWEAALSMDKLEGGHDQCMAQWSSLGSQQRSMGIMKVIHPDEYLWLQKKTLCTLIPQLSLPNSESPSVVLGWGRRILNVP